MVAPGVGVMVVEGLVRPGTVPLVPGVVIVPGVLIVPGVVIVPGAVLMGLGVLIGVGVGVGAVDRPRVVGVRRVDGVVDGDGLVIVGFVVVGLLCVPGVVVVVDGLVDVPGVIVCASTGAASASAPPATRTLIMMSAPVRRRGCAVVEWLKRGPPPKVPTFRRRHGCANPRA